MAIRDIENYLLSHPLQWASDRLSRLQDDYRLMSDYWLRGYADPHRSEVYADLLRRTFQLVSDVSADWQMGESTFLRTLRQRAVSTHRDSSLPALREAMEAFVVSEAMLALDPADVRMQKCEALYRHHYDTMNLIFDTVLTSPQWSESHADAFIDMLLSPTLSVLDQQLLVSAVMLSALQHFCFQKFRVLAQVYEQAADESLRQRALVGWVMAADAADSSLYPAMAQTVERLCRQESTRRELAELQMQLYYCLHADADRATIQNEILPDIMNGSNIKVTRSGLVEMDEDSMEDILHPEASELAMERMEQSMRRMTDMQKQGADIYFGGFSQMKRFPFFSDISNWFVPFYPEHPGISRTWNSTRGGNFLKAITRHGAFCDSDKYSFVLAFDMVLSRLPQSILKLIDSDEAKALPLGGEVDAEQQATPAFIRRSYLQGLFRFYRLFPSRSEFLPLFDTPSRLLFFASPLFAQSTMAPEAVAVARFLSKRHRYADAVRVLQQVPDAERDYQYFILMGTALQHASSEGITAADIFRQALALQPDGERAMAGLARQLFAEGNYAEALSLYEQLLAVKPDQRSYLLNSSVCMVNMGRSEEALKRLYKLYYDDADDTAVQRVMAWALTVDGKCQQAMRLFDVLTALDPCQPSDLLNSGYCLWLAGDVHRAADTFRRYVSTVPEADMKKEFTLGIEHELLQSHGIGPTEVSLMLDALV
jgi:tetratricopeptide (TPR) repeat protein